VIPETDARKAIDLAGQGCNVSEIARQVGHDRKTIRIYLNGHRAPGQPRQHAETFAPLAAYVMQRAADDPHLRSAGLHREAAALGYAGSYSAFTRELRASRLARESGITRLVLAEITARHDSIGGPEARRRATALAFAVPGLDPEHPDTAEAAAYPETIKVAAALLRTPGALPGGPE
jgi:hypothetical protein